MPTAARYNFPDWMEVPLKAALEDEFIACMKAWKLLLLIGAGMYAIARQNISRIANQLDFRSNGISFGSENGQIYVQPSLGIVNPTNVSPTVNSFTISAKYNNNRIIRGTVNSPFQIKPNDTTYVEPKLILSGISSGLAIYNALRGGSFNKFTVTGTFYTSSGNIPYKYEYTPDNA